MSNPKTRHNGLCRAQQPTRSRRRAAAEALAAAAAIAGGSHAYAAPIRFENPPGPGHFDWAGSLGSIRTLDIRQTAAGQTGSGSSASSFLQSSYAVGGYTYSLMYAANGGLEVTFGQSHWYVDDVVAGATIPGSLSFAGAAFIYYRVNSSIHTYLPNGATTYVGVRFQGPIGLQYGWIKVQRTGRALDALAWGYESSPTTPTTAGAGGPTPLPGDMNNDGAVTVLDVPAFVDALLGLPLPPGSVNRADMNASGAADGQDVQPFANAVVH